MAEIDLSQMENEVKEYDEEKEQYQNRGEGVNWAKLVAGDNNVRILPPKGTAKLPHHLIYVHFNIGPKNDKSIRCPGDNCPICHDVTELYNQSRNEKEDKKIKSIKAKASALRKKRQYLYNVFINGDETRVSVLTAGIKIWEQVSKIIVRFSKGQPHTVVDLIGGREIIIEKKVNPADKRDTTYICTPEMNSRDLDDAARAIADNKFLYDLDKVNPMLSLENIMKVIRGEKIDMGTTSFDYGNNATTHTGTAPAPPATQATTKQEDNLQERIAAKTKVQVKPKSNKSPITEHPADGQVDAPECYGTQEDCPECKSCIVNESCEFKPQPQQKPAPVVVKKQTQSTTDPAIDPLEAELLNTASGTTKKEVTIIKK